MRQLATRWFGGQYDAERGVSRFEGSSNRVRDGAAPHRPRGGSRIRTSRSSPWRNPGHVDGEELACLTEVRLRDLARAVGRILVKQVDGRGRGGG